MLDGADNAISLFKIEFASANILSFTSAIFLVLRPLNKSYYLKLYFSCRAAAFATR